MRKNTSRRDRTYVVAFLSSGSPREPLVGFVAADDYEQTRELVAVIRGSDGGGACMAPVTPFGPPTPNAFRTQIYNERIIYPGVWNKVVVVARENDDEATLDHALIQSRRHGRTWPHGACPHRPVEALGAG